MTPKEVLQLADWPTKYIVIDFETYFDNEYSLKKMNHWSYIKDERFEILGCGFYYYAHDEKSSNAFYWEPELTKQFEFLQARYGNSLEGITVVVQNGHFDCLILKEIYGILPKYVADIKQLDAHLDARRPHTLKAMAERNGLEAKGDTSQFLGQHINEVDREAMETYCLLDTELEKQLFEILLPQLTNPAFELQVAWHTTQLYLNPEIEFDFGLARKLKAEMQHYINASCLLVDMQSKDISGNLSFTAAIKEALEEIGENVPVKPAKRPGKNMTELLGRPNVGPAFAKDDDGMKELLAHTDDRVRQLAEARIAVKSWPNHIKRVEKMEAFAKAAGGKLPVPHSYYGAHTGRNQGSEGINLCNLGGRGRAGQGNHPLIGQIRNLLRAPEGKKLIIVDSAQIECRLEAWLAGQDDLLQGFANNEDVYGTFGQDIFKYPVRKSKSSDLPLVKKQLDIDRGFSKDTVLGAGYGMGPDKFYKNCLQNSALRPLFDSGKYDFRFVEKLVYGYRNKYSMVPKFWRTLEKMMGIVIKFPKEIYRYAAPGTPLGGGNDLLTLWNDNGTVYIQLPSGRCLRYPKARMNRGDGQIKWAHGSLWGGALTENLCQAIARDLLMWWIQKLERIGIHVVHHVYDEVIAIAPEEQADDYLETTIGVMRTAPAWGKTIPLDAEGCISDVYTK